ncbi:MAG: hypothetical protein FJX71_06600 [Alphaproteobacteria bacterium]|nr:hypothetical protein [Alphaproteobacteria bacterium]
MHTLSKLYLLIFISGGSILASSAADVLHQPADAPHGNKSSPHARSGRPLEEERRVEDTARQGIKSPLQTPPGDKSSQLDSSRSDLEKKLEIVKKEIRRIEGLHRELAQTFKSQKESEEDPYIQNYNMRIQELNAYLLKVKATTDQKDILAELEEIQRKHQPTTVMDE